MNNGQMQLPPAIASLAAPPVFVVGAHRSGTTWVFEALSAHPEVAGVFESYLFAPRAGFAGLLHDELWRHGVQGHSRNLTGHGVGVGQLVDRATAIDAVRDLSGRWLGEAIGTDDRYLVEKTPEHYMTVRLIAEVFPSARFVHVLRDGRDVAVSMRAAGRTWQPSWKALTYGPPWFAARRWAQTVATARRELMQIANPSLEVRYEDLHRDPEQTLRRLFDFCDIPVDDAMLSDIATRTSFSSHASTGEKRFFRRGEVGEWRTAFGRLDPLVFRLAAADVMAEAGYGPPPGPALRRAQRLLDRARAKRDDVLGSRR
jgi:hypothetical protein